MIKLNSWHLWLANISYKKYYPGMKINFCDYFWSVFSGLFKLLCFIFAVIITIVLTVNSYYELYMWYIHNLKMSEGAIVVVVLTLTCLVGLIAGWLIIKYIDYREKIELEYVVKIKKEPGFFTLAYRKFKEKTCFTVQIEGKE